MIATRAMFMFFILCEALLSLWAADVTSVTEPVPEIAVESKPLLTGTGATGSLWNTECSSLYMDTKCHAVGDLLTVIIAQQSSATTTAKHATGKDLNLNAGAGTGLLESFPGFGAKAGRTTGGTGAASTNSTFIDRLTVQVVEVLPNGNFSVEGKRTIKMEKDEMSLIFRGTVRSQDIQADNSVLSTYVADQQIETQGTGPIAEKSKPGLISRILSFLW